MTNSNQHQIPVRMVCFYLLEGSEAVVAYHVRRSSNVWSYSRGKLGVVIRDVAEPFADCKVIERRIFNFNDFEKYKPAEWRRLVNNARRLFSSQKKPKW